MERLGYSIRSVQKEFNISASESVSDQDIINHISATYGHRGVWLTKDRSSKREHGELIRASRISVIWIKRQTLSTIQQHRIVTHCYHYTYQDLVEANRAMRWEVNFHGQRNRERITLKRL